MQICPPSAPRLPAIALYGGFPLSTALAHAVAAMALYLDTTVHTGKTSLLDYVLSYIAIWKRWRSKNNN